MIRPRQSRKTTAASTAPHSPERSRAEWLPAPAMINQDLKENWDWKSGKSWSPSSFLHFPKADDDDDDDNDHHLLLILFLNISRWFNTNR